MVTEDQFSMCMYVRIIIDTFRSIYIKRQWLIQGVRINASIIYPGLYKLLAYTHFWNDSFGVWRNLSSLIKVTSLVTS